MTGTKVSSAASLLLNAASLSARDDLIPSVGSDFSDVLNSAASKDTMNLLPTAGSSASGGSSDSDMSVGVSAPVKVDRTRQLSVDESAKSATERPVSADNDSQIARDVVSKAAEATASENVNEAIEEIDEETMETIASAVVQAKEQVIDTLDITDEELVQGMEALEMTDGDILDTASIQPLVVEIAGEGDALLMATDEALFNTAAKLTEEIQTIDAALMTELGVADEESLKEIVSAYDAQTQTTQLTEETVTITQNAENDLPVGKEMMTGVVTDTAPEVTTDDPAHVMEDIPQDVSLTDSRTQHSDMEMAVPLVLETEAQVSEGSKVISPQKDEATARELVQEADAEKSPVDEALITDAGAAAEKSDAGAAAERSDDGEDTSADQKDKGSSDKDMQAVPEKKEDTSAGAAKSGSVATDIKSFVETMRPDGNVQAPVAQQGLSQSTVDAFDILRQINQNIRAEIGPQVTELSMHLNPESLGNLHIHISAKEGIITAQFVAESEAVKNALTAQTADLRENLENQGLKVEAVEVTIAGQELNRSYQQNGEGQGRFEEPKKKDKIHRIQLSGDASIDEIDGMELDEEDRLTAEMMAANGNTVDYKA